MTSWPDAPPRSFLLAPLGWLALRGKSGPWPKVPVPGIPIANRSVTRHFSRLLCDLVWPPATCGTVNTRTLIKLLWRFQSPIWTKTMQGAWNFLSLGINPGIIVEASVSLLPSFYLLSFFCRHRAQLSQAPQASVSQNASAWSSCLPLQAVLFIVTPLIP